MAVPSFDKMRSSDASGCQRAAPVDQPHKYGVHPKVQEEVDWPVLSPALILQAEESEVSHTCTGLAQYTN
jgi:hypothetical protein